MESKTDLIWRKTTPIGTPPFRQYLISSVVFLIAVLAITSAYMQYIWDLDLSAVIYPEGVLGTVMVAAILAALRPREGEYLKLRSRALWGLAIAHLFVAFVCVGTAVLTSDPSTIGAIIAYGVCGYTFSLVIWIVVYASELYALKKEELQESLKADLFLISLGPIIHFPIYSLVISTIFFGESIDTWMADWLNPLAYLQIYTPNLIFSLGTCVLLSSISYWLFKQDISTLSGFSTLLFFLLIYSLFTMLSYMGAAKAGAGTKQLIFSIIFPYGATYFFAIGIHYLGRLSPKNLRPNVGNSLIVIVCGVIAYFSFARIASNAALIFALIGVAVVGLFVTYLSTLEGRIKLRTAELKVEKDKSDGLLQNILPDYVIDDLKYRGTSEPRYFSNLSIMFTDFVGFTRATEELSAKELISQLNKIFSAFDTIVEEHDSERIKTIGDAYMCVSGLSPSQSTPVTNIVKIAFSMLDYLRKHNDTFATDWQMRIGIASGDCVGGVVGEKKYLFDLFGDTVNMASRMESHSEPGRINIDETTFNSAQSMISVHFEQRSATFVKGKGETTMYFVNAHSRKNLHS